MRIAFYTLGCKVNQYETQALEQLVTQRGHTLVPFDGEADAYVINTCSVTAVSDKKSRQVIRRARKTAPDAILAVCGCYSQTHPDDMDKLEVDLVAGTGDRTGFVDLLEQTWQKHQSITVLDDPFQRRTFENLPAGGLEGRTRAMLKIEDGCVNFCSYCIIPYARGPVRSEPLEQAVEQAGGLARAGYREVVLTGIEIASWGWDLKNGQSLTDLVEALCQALAGIRVRLGSLEPRIVTEEFCRRLSRYPNLCPQFHLSLQSGSDTVLARMRRKYTSARYFESVELLRRYFPGCSITTDLIVGFPGETEEELEESLAFARKCGFGAMHVFPYSRRPGTPAAGMPGQLSKAEKEARSARAVAVGQELERAYLTGLVGTVQEVLFEEPAEGGLYTGHAPNYAKIYAPGKALHNEVRPVRVTGLYRDGLLGELTVGAGE